MRLVSIICSMEKANSTLGCSLLFVYFGLVCTRMNFLFLLLLSFVVGGHKTACFVTAVGDFLCWRAHNCLFCDRCACFLLLAGT
jgi:hypothetical protein